MFFRVGFLMREETHVDFGGCHENTCSNLLLDHP